MENYVARAVGYQKVVREDAVSEISNISTGRLDMSRNMGMMRRDYRQSGSGILLVARNAIWMEQRGEQD